MYLSFTNYKINCVKRICRVTLLLRFEDSAELHYNTRTSKYLMFFAIFKISQSVEYYKYQKDEEYLQHERPVIACVLVYLR